MISRYFGSMLFRYTNSVFIDAQNCKAVKFINNYNFFTQYLPKCCFRQWCESAVQKTALLHCKILNYPTAFCSKFQLVRTGFNHISGNSVKIAIKPPFQTIFCIHFISVANRGFQEQPVLSIKNITWNVY